VRKPGRDLRDKVELLLAWRRVQKDVRDGLLGADFERAYHQEIQVKVAEAENDAKDEVWAGYRFVVLADSTDPSGLKVIDLGAGHSSASETLCGRIIAALKAEALLNESVGRDTSTGTGRRRSRTPVPGRSPACGRASSTGR
jgi:hypothetical protein